MNITARCEHCIEQLEMAIAMLTVGKNIEINELTGNSCQPTGHIWVREAKKEDSG